ncbi:MAG: protein kinase domain-containing protein [Myxococcota bacterium]
MGERPIAPKLVGRRVGNYVLDRALARGGMGSVFVAKHPQLGREVAVKFLSQELTSYPDLAQRFLSEARIAARLNHPNIVDILDFGDLEGRCYYVMELLRGHDLGERMKERHRFTPHEVLEYVRQICSALDAAHGAGVVHRDLKPANVFVLEGEPLRIKLVDFGVAKVLSTSGIKTRHGQVLGTPSHMAPEQALGDSPQVTAQSDIYSLGVIAYEMLSGTPVFHHESDVMLMVMHVRDPVRPLRELVPDLPPAVAQVIESCLAKDPKARPSSARVLAEELARAVSMHVEPPKPAARVDLVRAHIDTHHGNTHIGQAAHVEHAPVVGAVAIPNPIAERTAPVIMAAPAAAPDVPTSPPAMARAERAQPEIAKVKSPPPPAPAPQAQAAAEAPAPPAEPAVAQPAAQRLPERLDAPLGATAEQTLNKLMLRLKRQGDFPAFAQNVGEVSKKADATGAYSAGQLGAAILKDYALTAKLLRAVNSMYANRFGGKIYSIQHAIVILGFDRVRSLALSISLFKGTGKSGQSQRISDSAISSLVSGEIARNLAFDSKLNDEEAMVCAMFRDLGRHLVVVYLPELYDQVMALVQNEQISVRAASERVLGSSFARLGVAVAQTWRLPPRLLTAIAAVPSGSGPLTRAEDRLSALAEFANELCEIVASTPSATREREIGLLLTRHKHLVTIEQEAIPDLLEAVQNSFQERYSTLLGLDIKASRFLNNVAEVVKAQAAPTDENHAAPVAGPLAAVPHATSAQAAPRVPQGPAPNAGAPAAPEKIAIAPLQLGRRLAVDAQPSAATGLDAQIEEIRKKIAGRVPADVVLSLALSAFAEQLGVRRLLLLVATPQRDAFVVRYGIREDIDALGKELRFPLKLGRGVTDVFSSCYQNGRDARMEDALSPRANDMIPARYYEVIGSEAFAIYTCADKGVQPALVFCDVDSAEALPDPARVAALDALRPLLAQAAALRA